MVIAVCFFIVILYSGLLLWNFHKAVLFFAPVYVLFQDYMCLRYSSPAISLSFALEFLFILFAFFNHKLKWKGFPLKTSFLLLFSLFFIGIFVTKLDFVQTIPYVVDLISSYIIVVIFYNELQTPKDIKIALRLFLTMSTVFLIYGLFEFVIQSNPIMDYVRDLIPDLWGGTLYLTEEERFGSIRCQSLMTICISWGALCCLILTVLLYAKYVFKEKINNAIFAVFVLLILICIYSSGSRSAYIYIACLLFGTYASFKGKNKIFLILIGLVGLYFAKDYLIDIISSFNPSEDNGSSSGQRQMQLLAVMKVISESPLLGLGSKGVILGQDLNGDILGAESIWFQVLLSYGFIGVFVQIYLYASCIIVLRKHSHHFRSLAFFSVFGWVAFSSLSSSPGLTEPYFLMILVLLLRMSDLQPKYEYGT